MGKAGAGQETGGQCGTLVQRNMEQCIMGNVAALDCWAEAKRVSKKQLEDGPFRSNCDVAHKDKVHLRLKAEAANQRRHH